MNPKHLLFPVEESLIHVHFIYDSKDRKRRLAGKKAVVAADTGKIIGIVGSKHKVLANRDVLTLCQEFCREAFPDVDESEWSFEKGHGPATRSWAALDIHIRPRRINIGGQDLGHSEWFTPFVRVTNSFNGRRARRIDIGFFWGGNPKGIIFLDKAVSGMGINARQGGYTFKNDCCHSSMASLTDDFSRTITNLRSISVTKDDAIHLVRLVVRWPKLPEVATKWEQNDQKLLDEQLEGQLHDSIGRLGSNAFAVLDTMAYVASYPWRGDRFHPELPTLQRRVGEWARLINLSVRDAGFTVSGHIMDLSARDEFRR